MPRRQLKLRWLPVALLLIAAFTSLGLWQYGRGQEKALWLAEFEAALVAPPQPLHSALRAPIRPARPVAGELRAAAGAPWWLLDNARRGREVGVRALAAYEAPSGRELLLVDFGWLPLPPDRRLPELAPPPARLDARGLLVVPPGQGLRMGTPEPPAAGVRHVLLQYLDLAQIGDWLDRPLLPLLLRLDPDLPVGFVRDLEALPNTLPPEKHYGYAAQWWGLAAATAAIYLVLALKRSTR